MQETAIELKPKIELPKIPLKPTKTVPSSMILFGLPKVGKTTILSKLPNCFNIDVESGASFIENLRLQPPADTGPVGVYQWFKDVVSEIKNSGHPYDFVCIDTISHLDQLSEWIGTFQYMNSAQGKSFNRVDNKKGGEFLPPDHPDYESVHTLPDGNGYRYSRKVMTDILDMCKGLGKVCTIFVCHVTDKYVLSKQTNTEVRALDFSLTGKVRNIYARDVDCIGYVWNKAGEMQVSFKGDEDKLGGMRGTEHIQGYEGRLDWDMIFKLGNNKNK